MYKSTDILVHRSRFFNAELHSINCIAFNEKDQKVALLRRRIRKFQPSQNEMHSVIEIWNLQNKASFLEQVICDDSDNLALLEDLAWSKSGRLFSCGLNTYVNEYDLEIGRVKQSNCVNSSPAWCLALNDEDNLLAIGTEDGHICVFNICADSFQYEKIVDPNDNRILCLQWFFPREGRHEPMLVGGSIDYIKIWSYRSGRCTDFIKVGNTGVVVWCLKVLPDFTIVSGDSSGTTSFWNGSTCTLNSSFRAHKGDVLAVCANSSNNQVYSAGVDPAIIQFNRKSGKVNSWTVSITRRPHTHDVRSLVSTSTNWLFSGGVDSSFVQTNLDPSKNLQIDHLSNFGHKITTIAAERGNYVFFQYEKFLELWKMGTPESDLPEHVGGTNSVQVTPLKIAENAFRLLEIKSRKSIIIATANSQWIVYANFANIKVILWTEETIQKVKALHDPIPNVSLLSLTEGNRLVLSYGKTVETLKLDKFGVLAESSRQLKGRVNRMVTAGDKVIVSLANEQNSIVVLNSGTLNVLATFGAPLMPSAVRANTSFGKHHLWVALPNALLLQYDLDSMTLAKSYPLSKFKSNDNSEGFTEYWPIKQLAFGENVVMYSSDHSLYCLQLVKQRITKCNKYQHILFMDNVGPQEAVLVEVTPQMLLSKLPPTLISKTFGT